MITYEKLRKKPRALKSIAGVTTSEFEELCRKLVPAWNASEHKRLSRPNRQRAIGGGRRYALQLQEQLLLTLVWLRLHLTTEALGVFFDIHKSTASRNTRRLLPILRQLGDATLGWPDPPKRGKGKSVEQALRDCPDLLATIEATEQAIQRPSDNEQ